MAPNALQSEMAATQDKNWVIIQEEVATYELIFQTLRDCFRLLQPNFNFNNVSSLPAPIHDGVKSNPSALFAFRNNFLSSIPVLFKGHSPMSLVHLQSVLAIMDNVSLWQSKAEYRLTLAIPAIDLLS